MCLERRGGLFLDSDYEEKGKIPTKIEEETPEEDGNYQIALWLLVGISFSFSAPLGFLCLFLKLFGFKNLMQGVRDMIGSEDSEFKGKTAEFQQKANAEKKSNTWEKVLQETGIGKAINETVSTIQLKEQRKFAQRKLKHYGKEQAWVNGFMASVFGIASLNSLSSGFDGSLATMLLFTGIFGNFCYKGIAKQKQGKRMLQYYNVVEGSAQFSIARLSELVHLSPKIICKDLEDMISIGVLKNGFIDHANGVLVLQNREEYLAQYQSKPVEAKKKKKHKNVIDVPDELVETTEHELLTEIRGINQQIQNKKLSAQIDHIGMITGKILEFQEVSELKDRELHSFLSYYLPTTLKLLHSYRKLESQNIEGDNISKSKLQIEEMMDKIVEGFEKQLDQLFEDNTMDIAADISVLEQMFQKDGLIGTVLTLEDVSVDNSTNPFDINLKL